MLKPINEHLDKVTIKDVEDNKLIGDKELKRDLTGSGNGVRRNRNTYSYSAATCDFHRFGGCPIRKKKAKRIRNHKKDYEPSFKWVSTSSQSKNKA